MWSPLTFKSLLFEILSHPLLASKAFPSYLIGFFFFFFKYLFLIDWWLIYNIGLISAIRQHELTKVNSYVLPLCPPSWISLPPLTPSHTSRLLRSLSLRSLSPIASSHWHMLVRFCHFKWPNQEHSASSSDQCSTLLFLLYLIFFTSLHFFNLKNAYWNIVDFQCCVCLRWRSALFSMACKIQNDLASFWFSTLNSPPTQTFSPYDLLSAAQVRVWTLGDTVLDSGWFCL